MTNRKIMTGTHQFDGRHLDADMLNRFTRPGLPQRQGLYDPARERDACGIGFVVNIHNKKSRQIVEDGLAVLRNLEHRGAVGADPKAGDGCGMLTQLPHAFFSEEAGRLGFTLPEPGHYGVCYLFLPHRDEHRTVIEHTLEETALEEGLQVIGWRDVPVDNSVLGETVLPTEPVHRQAFIARGDGITNEETFERKLSVMRKVLSNRVLNMQDIEFADYYVTSCSARTVTYKGMFLAPALAQYYPDLADPRYVSALALVHQRFSTNTFPSWSLAQPFRLTCHNGEINTLRGNMNWMNARYANMSSPVYGDDMAKVWPISYEGQSDSACFDNALELLYQGGYPLAHAMMMMIPEAWYGNPLMDEDRRAFYEHHASLMEPWDGPAAIAFTDGKQIGATLDRNGLRPARYLVTDDGMVLMSSEMGVLPVDESRIVSEMAPAAGQDAADRSGGQGRIIADEELKAQTWPARNPYQEWLDRTQILLKQPARGRRPRAAHQCQPAQPAAGLRLHPGRHQVPDDADGLDRPGSGRLHGHGHADFGAVLQAEASAHLFQAALRPGHQPADRPDPRGTGDVAGLLHRPGQTCSICRAPRRSSGWKSSQPILKNEDLEKIRTIGDIADNHFQTLTLDITYSGGQGQGRHAEPALDRLCERAEQAVGDGYQHHHPVRPPVQHGPDPDPLAAGDVGRAPSPDPAGPAHLGRPRGRDRRGARDPSVLHARRLWRGGHQPLSRLRDP